MAYKHILNGLSEDKIHESSQMLFNTVSPPIRSKKITAQTQ